MKLTIIVPDELHRAVKAAAASRGDTMTSIVVEAFEHYLGENDAWVRWDNALEQAKHLRDQQRARRGAWQGPDMATLVEESRAQRTEEINHAISSR